MGAVASTGLDGVWRPANSFVPLPYPEALAAVARADAGTAVRNLIRGGKAPIQSQTAAHPIASLGLQFIDQRCVVDQVMGDAQGISVVQSPVYCVGDSGILSPAFQQKERIPSGAGSETSAWEPRTCRGGFAPGEISQKTAVHDANSTVQISLYPSSGRMQWLASCPATAPRILDVALQASAISSALALLDAGSVSGEAPIATFFDWASILDQGNGEVKYGKWGRLGVLSRMPEWKCKSRESDGGGCAGHAKFDDCDHSTGEGCPCFGDEPADSEFVCVPEPNMGPGPKYRLIRKSKTRTWTETSFSKKSITVTVSASLRSQRGKKNKAKRCSPNPFKNLLWFVFCIILLVIEAIMKAIFGFPQIEAAGGGAMLAAPGHFGHPFGSSVLPISPLRSIDPIDHGLSFLSVNGGPTDPRSQPFGFDSMLEVAHATR